jgi:polysaccharide biosynthesis transport protein
MSSGTNNNQNGSDPHAGGLTLEDVYFTVFRHKWLILAFVCLGLLGALMVPIFRPPPYISWAKVMVRYVIEAKGANLAGPDAQIKSTDMGAQGLINSELEIIRSADVASNVAAVVGPERILAKVGGGSDPNRATAVVFSGLEVENPRGTEVLTISFRHRDRSLVQPVLSALVETYMRKHWEVWRGGDEMNEYYNQQSKELRSKLAQTEDELRKIKKQAKVVSVEQTKHAYDESLRKWREDLLTAQGELNERKAMLDNAAASEAAGSDSIRTNGPPVSLEKIEDYSTTLSDLDAAKRHEHELLQRYTKEYPLVQTVEAQIANLKQRKAEMERECPSLAHLGLTAGRGSTNSPGADMAGDLANIRRLTARVTYIGSVISNIEAQASQVLEIEPRIKELERARDMDETNYLSIAGLVRQALISKDLGAGKVNMSLLQQPTAPSLDLKKFKKLLAGVLGGCVACGIGLAFLIDFVLNRTIRRPADIERNLRMRVFLTIPDTTWNNHLRLPWLAKWWPWTKTASARPGANGAGSSETSILPWTPGHHLQTYSEGLRERIITYFEVNNLNLKKPKLVAVTGCGKDSGVSTLASGLASALSKTGDGNVLLVDMNEGQGTAHPFYKGEPGCGLSDVLEPETRSEGQVHDKLYLATITNGDQDQLTKVLPTKFNHLVPKLKASDYDYIIFDMPPISQTSATPRLASYMDITLLVLESEKTGQQLASRASALMRESRANVAAVLNKYRPHVPVKLSQDL